MMERPRLYGALASVSGFVLALVAAFVALVTYQTLAKKEPPLRMETLSSTAYQWKGDTVFVYERRITAAAEVQVLLQRVITCTLDRGIISYDLPAVNRAYKKGEERIVRRLVTYPELLPTGTPCQLSTTVKWSPDFSMNWQLAEMDDINFEVGK
jgi:hypothetical protein